MIRQTKALAKDGGSSVHPPRRRRAMGKFRAARVDAMLVNNPVEVGYLTGFMGDDSFLLLGAGWTCLVTDGRFTEQAAKECGDIECHVRNGSIESAIAKVLEGRGVRKLGFEPRCVTVKLRQELADKLKGKKLVEVSGVVSILRQCKDDGELAIMRRAIRIAEKAFKEMLALGVKGWVGRCERDLAAELDYRMRRNGADAPGFPTILAAGAHGSVPHYRPDSTRVRPGQAVLVDWGARVEGYCSDLTRVVFTGTIPAKLREIYEVVRRAQEAGIAAIRPGVGCKAIDAAARRVIVEAGYGEQFVHGLGHGLGREVHEAPGLGKLSTARLKSGMVVTVEPGIYLPGIGGVRIEDDVLVTASSARRLSSLPRDIDAMRL